MLRLAKAIDRMNEAIGKNVAWLILLAIIISAVNAIIRKAFDTSSNAWLEAQWVLFGAVFLLCSPWTLLSNEHIRIDVVSSHLSKRTRDWIDVFGHVVFLIPLCLVMLSTAIPFAWESIKINEQSFSAGGLPQWPAKTLVPFGFFFLLLQAVSELIKRLAIINGQMKDPHAASGHGAGAEAEAERLKAALEEETAKRAA